MQYMLLIYSQEDGWEALSDEERNALYREYSQLSDDLRDKGALLGAHELQPAESATTVRVRDGDRLVTDGPFAETREVLGGYYLIEVESLDEALDWAARIPSARHGQVEVRPVVMREAD